MFPAEISVDTDDHRELVRGLLALFGQAVEIVWPQWQCTSVEVQRNNLVPGLGQDLEASASVSGRVFQFVFQQGHPHISEEGWVGPVPGDEHATGDVWFEGMACYGSVRLQTPEVEGVPASRVRFHQSQKRPTLPLVQCDGAVRLSVGSMRRGSQA